MSGTVATVALVVGAFLLSGALRGAGGGAVYLLAGVIIGPRLLGLIEEDTLAALRPVLHVTCAWLGLALGLRQRARYLRRLPVWGLLLQWGLPCLLLFAVLPWAGARLGTVPADAALAAGLGAAAVLAATGPGLLGLARETPGAGTPRAQRLGAILHNDILLTLAALVALLALAPPPGAPTLGPHALFVPAATLLLGAALGAGFTLLGGRRPDRDTAWVLLIGVLLLGTGLAARLALPGLCVAFLTGATIAATGADYALLDELAGRTRGPVEVLLLLLAGMICGPVPGALALCALALALRTAAKLAAGGVLGLGGGLLGFGAAPLAAALQVELLYGGPLGGALLLLAAAQLVLGDLLGPFAVRGVLRQAGAAEPVEPAEDLR